MFEKKEALSHDMFKMRLAKCACAGGNCHEDKETQLGMVASRQLVDMDNMAACIFADADNKSCARQPGSK